MWIFSGILMISASLYMIGLLHGIFWLKEPKQHAENVKKKAMIIDIFNYQNIIDPFKLLFTSSPGNNRLVIILVMFLIFIITGICQGKNTVYYATKIWGFKSAMSFSAVQQCFLEIWFELNQHNLVSRLIRKSVCYNIHFWLPAENSVLFLFLQSTYNWTPIQFSYYQTIQTMLHLLGKYLVAVV